MHRRLAAVAAAALLAAAPAAAQESILDRPPEKEAWPIRIVERPLTLAQDMFELTLPVNANLSPGDFAKPVFLNPSLYYGVTPFLTVGVRHFVGLCVSGAADGCPDVYRDVSLDAIWSVVRGGGAGGGLDVALGAALNATHLSDPFTSSVEARLTVRYRAGTMAALTLAPQLDVGLTQRDVAPGGTPIAGTTATTAAFGNREILTVPASLQVQVLEPLAISAGLALVGELDPLVGSFGDTYTIPVSAEVDWSFTNTVDVGATLSFLNLLGKDSTADQRFGKVFVRARF